MIARSVSKVVLMAAVVFAFVAALGTAHAQKPTANAMAIAREIVALKGSEALYSPLVPGVIDRVRVMNLQTNPMLSKPLEEVAAALRKEYATKVAAELGNNLARIYATRFTEPELKAVLAFYKSPAGKKVIAVEPLVLEEFVGQLAKWQDKFAEEILRRFRVEMKKRGHEL